MLNSNHQTKALVPYINPNRGDWTLYYEDPKNPGQPDLSSPIAGYMLFGDRLYGLSQSARYQKFAFAPGIAGGLFGDTNTDLPGFQGDVRIHYTKGGVGATLDLRIAPGLSGLPWGDVDSVNGYTAIQVAKVQQRLNYLGYVDETGIPLVVDGILGPHTAHAIALFNAVVGDTSLTAVSSTIVSSQINSASAPRWQELSAGGTGWINQTGGADSGADWALSVLERAGQANDSAEPLHVRYISTRTGGTVQSYPYDSEASPVHEAGLDIDIAGPSTASLRGQIRAFVGALGSTGATISQIYCGNPITWDIPGVVPNGGPMDHFRVHIAPPAEPANDFTWKMVDRVVKDVNGRIVLPNTPQYAQPACFGVDFDVSGIRLDGGLVPGDFTFQFQNPGGTIIKTSADQETPFPLVYREFLPQGADVVTVTAFLHDSQHSGLSKTFQQQIDVHDLLFVAIGDSYSAGEGNPEIVRDPNDPDSVGQWATAVSPDPEIIPNPPDPGTINLKDQEHFQAQPLSYAASANLRATGAARSAHLRDFRLRLCLWCDHT